MKITESGTYADITQITDYLEIARGVTAKLPNLTSVGSYVYVRENAKFTAPNLTSVGGVYVRENAKLTASNLTSVGSYVYVYENAKFTAPNLTSVGGVYVRENAKFTAPNLTSVGGGVYVYENAKFTRSETDVPYEAAMLERSFNSVGHTYADRIVAKILHTRGQVRKIIIAGQTEPSYLVSNGDYHAHGETLKQAKESLEFKINAKQIKNGPIDADTIITIPYYRTVTGACESGVRQWMDATFTAKKKADILKNGITAKELLPILDEFNAYGFDKFASLVTFGGAK